MRKIAVLTESRADYGIYLPLLRAIKACPDLELDLLVTGQHILHKFGFTLKEIEFPHQTYYDIWEDLHFKADWLIVLGDRMPMLEATIVAAELGIPIAHIQGGDVTTGACLDESIRHAITRFAHLHFPSCESSARRLIRWGEESWRVKVVGPLGIYAMKDDLRSLYDAILDPIVLIIQHPVNGKTAAREMDITLRAVGPIENIYPIVIFPNSDDGGQAMIEVIKSYKISSHANLPYLQFMSLLKASSVLVGNSSVSLHEAPLFGVPVVNIGDREKGRERWGHAIDVPHDSDKIKEAIEWSLKHGKYPPLKLRNINGVNIIIKALVETPIDEKLLRKGYV